MTEKEREREDALHICMFLNICMHMHVHVCTSISICPFSLIGNNGEDAAFGTQPFGWNQRL